MAIDFSNIENEYTRIQTAKANIITAMNQLGANISEDSKMDEISVNIESTAEKVDSSNTTATPDKLFLNETAISNNETITGTFTIDEELNTQNNLINQITNKLQLKVAYIDTDHYDMFWDIFQQNGNRKYYPYAFSFGWNDENFKPKYPLTNMSQATYMFFNSEITNLNVSIDISSIRADAIFSQCKKLQTINKLIVDDKTILSSNSFYQCNALENITIEGVIATDINIQYSPLSKVSITSVINALSSSASGKTLTLSAAAKTNAFTDSEWSALIATKTNWTISLI